LTLYSIDEIINYKKRIKVKIMRKENNVATIGEIVKFLNGNDKMNAKSKKSAAAFVAQFTGYETARANTPEDGYDNPCIIITTPKGHEINIWWEKDVKVWRSGIHKSRFITIYDYERGITRRLASHQGRDQLIIDTFGRGFVNRAVSKYRAEKKDEVYRQLKAAKEEVIRLEKLYYSTPSY
jgi:hypothetical protein